jgi:Transglycosylase SLT domain
VGYTNGEDGASAGALPSFVPARFAAAIARAAQRWSVSGALLAAQLYEESHFNPFARSAAGALGIAQFMPATATGCVPAIPETQSYVADILGLLHGAGDPSGDGAAGLVVRLVR